MKCPFVDYFQNLKAEDKYKMKKINLVVRYLIAPALVKELVDHAEVMF